MITREDLLQAIAECKSVRDPNANTCIKLAAYQTILDHMDQETYSRAQEPAEQVRYDSGSEFSRAIARRNMHDVLGVIDDLMDTIQMVSPRLYRATIDSLLNTRIKV